jgi:site-specific recombinase
MANMLDDRKPQDWINLIIAACLFISPWVVGFAGVTSPAWNAWIIAVALAIVTIIALSAAAEWEEWVNVIFGLWLIVSPWVLGFADNAGALWTHLILGVITAAVAGWAVWDFRHDRHVAA